MTRKKSLNVHNTKKPSWCVKVKKIAYDEEYKYLDNRVIRKNNRSIREVKVQCPNNHEPYWVRVYNFTNGTRCKECMKDKFAKERRLSFDHVKSYIESYGYEVISTEYINNVTPLDLVCPRGHEYQANWIMFKSNGNRCSRCKSSKGENIIRFILESYNIEFEEEYPITYKGKNLVFDFYIPSINLYIEHQGEQHFMIEESIKWVGIESIKKQQYYDTLKREYCKKVVGDLIETTYKHTPKDIHSILVERLHLNKIDLDLSRAEYYTKRLDVTELLRFYRWHTLKETSDKFGVSETQILRYAKGTGTKIKPVKQIKDGRVVAVYDTQKEVEEELNIQINGALRGRNKTAGGYEWAYVTQEEYEEWRGYNG